MAQVRSGLTAAWKLGRDRTALIVFLGFHLWVLHPQVSLVRCPVLRCLSVDVSLS
jgi:hypothetical protein